VRAGGVASSERPGGVKVRSPVARNLGHDETVKKKRIETRAEMGEPEEKEVLRVFQEAGLTRRAKGDLCGLTGGNAGISSDEGAGFAKTRRPGAETPRASYGHWGQEAHSSTRP